jgi:phosphoribosylformimino-5-aminoimidazole carboxamide ribotide isomerase
VLLIPAIDLHDGNCVRLVQGRMEEAKIYSSMPSAMAKHWADFGVQRLHVVDLDGAFAGTSRNLAAIESICQSIEVPVEVGGGLRDIQSIKTIFNCGVTYAILGTAAVRNPEFVEEACAEYPGRIILGIDAKNGYVSLEGWTEATALTAAELALKSKNAGVSAIIYTDISRDGMLTGPNFDATMKLAQETGMPVIASGGISSIDDIKRLLELEENGVIGAILGKSLYEGRIDLADALKQVVPC